MKFLPIITIVAALAPNLAAAQGARSCGEAVAKCRMEGAGKPNIAQKCAAAGAKCNQTGTFVGPITGRKWTIGGR